jgi:mRNA interferase MazF
VQLRDGRNDNLTRGMIIDVNLDPVKGSETGKVRPCVIVTNNDYNARLPVIQVVPLTSWSERKASVKTNVAVAPTPQNGLTKLSIADCLQTRPIDHRYRMVKVRGSLDTMTMHNIDVALRKVFSL